MTKAKVLALVKKQGAFIDIYGATSELRVDVWLPEQLMWSSGYGACSQEFSKHEETKAEFWSELYDFINHEVVPRDDYIRQPLP